MPKLKTLIFITFFFVVTTVSVGYFYLYNFLSSEISLMDKLNFEIREGDSVSSVSERLYEMDLVGNPKLFVLADKVLSFPKDQVYLQGKYIIPENTSLREISQIFKSGNVEQQKITLIEGWTVKRIIDKVNSEIPKGEITEIPVEGSLFPDTYLFDSNTSKMTIINNLRNKMDTVVDELWQTRPSNSILKSKEEMIILASIIEKETGRVSDMANISSVFTNRLRKGRRLESCPTVIYGLSDGLGYIDRPLLIKDLTFKHSHNTYIKSGLPPTAISNPGYNALKAALFPANTDYLFFVSDGQGGTRFSKNLKDHNYKAQQLFRYNDSVKNN